MAESLAVLIKTTNEFILVDSEYTNITAIVTSKAKVVAGTTVTFSITNGKTGVFKVASGTTDAQGQFTTRFSASETGYFDIQAAASKTGYTATTGTINILGVEVKSDFTSLGTLYLNLIEKRKTCILKVLQNYLDNEKQFYVGTGASDTIQYLTEWNFQLQNFPQIIVSKSSGPTYNSSGLGDIIDTSTWGGWADVTFGINIVSENITILDRLTQKVIFILGSLKNNELYARYGIAIKLPITTGGLITESYGAKMLFANQVSMATRIELAYNMVANDVIESIPVTQTTL